MIRADELRNSLGFRLLRPAQPAAPVEAQLFAVLRVTAALCFFGHGAWGLVAKAAWVPFFTSVGIPEAWAWKLMPLVGAHDIALGLLMLWKPRRALAMWMALWCVWTALLRPISGLSHWEVWERAGNYGPPLVMLMLGGPFAWKARSLLGEFFPLPLTPERRRLISLAMRVFLATLLLGHAGFALDLQKPQLVAHWASLGFTPPPWLLSAQGVIEVSLAALLMAEHRFLRAVLVAVLAWKLGTEFLYVTHGPAMNLFEWIERWGDYGLPLALLYLHRGRKEPSP